MKQRFKKLMTIMLAASLCVPMIPGTSLKAASAATTFTEEEDVAVSGLGTERSTLFNDGWKFFLGESSSAQDPDFNDAGWTSVDLPHDFSIGQTFTTSGEAESGFLPGGTGWYRKSFTLPSTCSGKSLVLNFDGVYSHAYVYVNGTKVGEHHYGYTSFAFDISDYVTCDGLTENVIAVQAVNKLPSSRWYSGSGIYRDVSLIITDPVHVDLNGTQVTTPDIQDGIGTVDVNVDVVNDSLSSSEITVRNTVYTKDGEKASEPSETTISLNAGASATVNTKSTVVSPQLWSIDTPVMYYVQTELLSGGSVVDTYDTAFGFRWYSFNANTGFALNGENVKLNGVCMHHDQGALGSAAYYDAMYRQLSIMKNMGVNVIRATHNPYDEDFIDICNELGLLVIEEAFDGWDRAKNGNSNDFSAYFNRTISEDNQILGGSSSMSWAEFAIKSMVKRDRNDPSIILWSLGNEISEGTNGDCAHFPTIAENLISWIKELDTSHPVTLGSNQRTTTGSIAQTMNVVTQSGGVAGYNYASSSELDYYANYHGNIILASETASATNSRGIYVSQSNNTNVDGKLHLTSYDTSTVGWGKTAHASMWDTLTKDYVAGECVWTGFDYIGEPTPWNGIGTGSVSGRGAMPNSSYFGIVETTGFPKDTYYLYRSQWNQDSTTLHLVTAWDSDNMMTSNGKTPVWVYSNAAKVELYRDDTLIGTATRKVNTTDAGHEYYTYTTQSNDSSLCTTTSGSNSTSLYSVFNVTYTDGTIHAKAYDENDNEITDFEGTASVSTPDSVSKLQVSQNKTSIAADGSSLAYIAVDVTDEAGNLDTTATNNIRFTLTGEGEILGVDNGDQATLDKYQQASVLSGTTSANINAYAGKALVIVRSTTKSGSFTVDVASDGLTGGSATVTTTASGNDSSNGLLSYRMSRHLYAPVGSASITLPSSVKASYADGSNKTFPITWNTYDKANLSKVGAFRIDGSFSDGKQTVNLFITAHMYGQIQSAENYSCMTKPGTMPTLPSVSMTYFADGSQFEAFPVTWDLSKITDDMFTLGKIVTINGTVTAFGESYPVTATVRVAEPVVDTYDNVGTTVLHLTDNGPYSDTLESIIDGAREDNGTSPSRWTTWGKKDDLSFTEDAVITMDWATAVSTDQINLFFFYQSTDSQSELPPSIKFEYTLSSSWDGTNINSDTWTEIKTVGEPEEISTSYQLTTGRSYKLEKTINPIAIRISFGHTPGKFIGLNEVEIMSPTTSYYANTSADLKGITAGGVKVNFGSETTYDIDAPSFDNLSVDNDQNAAVTIVPISNREIRIVSVSEDGKTTKTYTVTLKNVALIDPVVEAQRKDLTTKLNEAKAIDSKLYTADSYAKLQSIVKEIEANIATATAAQMTDYAARLASAKAALVKAPVVIPTPVLQKGDKVTVNKVQYKVINVSKKTVAAVKGLSNKKTKVTIPATVKVNGISCKVVQISAKAFKGYSKLKTLTIGKNVTTIGKNSFNGCKKLTKVVFKGTAVKTIKSGAFKKTGSKMTVSAPKKLRTSKNFKNKLTKAGMTKKLKLK